MRYICTSIVATLMLAGTTWAATITVPDDYASIQAAIDASSDGDEIHVHAGIYTDVYDGFIVNTKGKAITLKAIDGAGSAVIDGSGQWRGCSFTNGEMNDTVIDGFTIRDCNSGGPVVDGGAIWCHGASPSILNCVITSNTGTGYGAGICCYLGASPIISGCTITNNTGTGDWGTGAGISAYSPGVAPIISDCLISGNHTTQAGGGMRLGITLPPIRGCTITNNTSGHTGGGVHIDSGNQEFIDCIFDGNIATEDGGAVTIVWSTSKFMNCQFTNNQAGRGGGLYLDTEIGSATAILDGCTVAGNTALTSGGGGIKADGQMISLIDCMITGNTALGSGGGLDCVGNGASITNCHFANNTVTGSKSYGGAIRLYNSAGSISDCTIEGNAASFWGGGISLYESSATIANCLIRNNSTDQVGGGIAVQNSSPLIMDCTISGNSAASYGGGLRTANSDVALASNVFCANSPDDIGGDWTDIVDNIFAGECPVYVGACCTNGGCVQVLPEECDSYLGKWLGAASSCDDCPPTVEPDDTGACCVQGYCTSMTEAQCFDLSGSYAGDNVICDDAGCPEFCPGDIDGDGQVGIVDMLTVIGTWGPCS